MKRRLSQILLVVLMAASLAYPLEQAAASGTLTAVSLTLGDPRPSAASVLYTFGFTAATNATLKCVTFTFWTTPNGSTEPPGLTTNGSTKGTFTGTGITNANWSIPGSPTEGTIKTTNSTGDAITATTAITMPFTVVSNPSSATTFYVQIQDFTDTGCSVPTGGNDAVVIAAPTVSGTQISATINPTLSFTVAGLGNGATIKSGVLTQGAGDPCSVSTATAISFPTDMLPGTNYICGQSLTVSTNAQSGYSVTLRGTNAGANFLRGTPGTLQITDQTGTNATPTAFASPTAFGYTSNETTLQSGTTGRFGSNNVWAQVGFTGTSEQVAYQPAPANAHVTNIGYQIVFAGTVASSVYTGTVIYTCTATF